MKSKFKVFCMLLLDIFIINISIFISYLLVINGDFNDISKSVIKVIPLILLFITLSKLFVFSIFKIYKSLWRYVGIHELSSIVFAVFISNSILFLTTNIIFSTYLPKGLFIIALFVDISLIGGSRLAYRLVRRVLNGQVKFFKNYKKILIVGAGDVGSLVINELKIHSNFKLEPVAVIDDDNGKFGRKIHGVPIVGRLKVLKITIEKFKIDEIIIAIDSDDTKVINKIYEECSKTKCKVKILPPLNQLFDQNFVFQKLRDVNIEDLLGRKPIILEHNEISFFLKGKTVLVTGGGGSIGSELCRQISKFLPKKLIILDNYENNAYSIQNDLISKYPNLKLELIIANIREKHRIELIFKEFKPQVVFHAAAHKHVPLMENNPTEAISNNIIGTLNVVECSHKFNIEKFVLISTDKAVNPTNIMGASKRVAEMIIQGINKQSFTDFVAVRFGNVLGSNGSVIPLFKEQIKKGGPITVTHPDINRFFMTIPEASQLVLQAGAMAKGGEIFVLDMGEPVKICDLATKLIKLSGYEPNKDIEIRYTGLRPGEKLYEELMLKEEGMQKTKNSKIYIAQPLIFSFKKLKKDIECLKDIILTNPEHSIDFIKTLVPTYKVFTENKKTKKILNSKEKINIGLSKE
ncbi:MAG: nucleoside-diphosphate sugar epimerase/dehydratase [Clostridiales bacterium]